MEAPEKDTEIHFLAAELDRARAHAAEASSELLKFRMAPPDTPTAWRHAFQRTEEAARKAVDDLKKALDILAELRTKSAPGD